MNSDDTNFIVFMLRIKSKTANGKVKQNYHKEVKLILELSGIFSFSFLHKITIKFIIQVAKFHTDNPEFGLF